jgi:hypothetical protein
MLPFGMYLDTGYKIALFFHILAVVVAFGPTFGYALLFAVAPQFPRAAPALLRGIQQIDRYLVNPGMIVILIAGIVLMAVGDNVWDGSEFFIVWGFIAIIALFAIQHAYFQPAVRKAIDLADRDLKQGDALSPEFEALSKQYGQVGALAGVLVVVTIFFMVYKPFMRATLRCRWRCSTRASAGSPFCTSASSRCRRRTTSTWATPSCFRTALVTLRSCASGSRRSPTCSSAAAPSCW